MLACTTLSFIINHNTYFKLPPVYWHLYFTRYRSDIFKVWWDIYILCCKLTNESAGERILTLAFEEVIGKSLVSCFLTHGVVIKLTHNDVRCPYLIRTSWYPSGARESANPMIREFQHTTVASIGLLAQANTVCISAVVKVDRRIRWHYTTTILRLHIGARLTGYRNCKFHNFARTISRHADGISRYSVPPSAGPLLPLHFCRSSQPRRLASPAIAIRSKNCTASAAVAVDSGHWTVNVSYATATAL